jgi:hypothetical protein
MEVGCGVSLSYVDQLKARRPTPKIGRMSLSLEKIGSDRMQRARRS